MEYKILKRPPLIQGHIKFERMFDQRLDFMSHEQSFKMINELSFCVFDLETTGGNQTSDKIIEIGLIKIENLKIIAEKSFLIKPMVQIPEFIQKLTSIREADVVHAPLIEDVIDEVLEFIGDSILVAHNTSFDVPFFNSVLKRMGRSELKNNALCTHLMTKYMIPNLLTSNLNNMSKIFGLNHHKAHRALDDARASAELLLTYLNIFIKKDIKKINHLYYPKNKFELDRIHFKGKSEFTKFKNKVIEIKSNFLLTVKGKEGIVLYAEVVPVDRLIDEKRMELLLKIIEEVSTMQYEVLSLKLVGPFIIGLIEYAQHFTKLSAEKKLTSLHRMLSHFNLSEKCLQEYRLNINQRSCEFFILNHIVPDQYIIYPRTSLTHKAELYFRYPGHQNKLLQYINSKGNKVINGKLPKDHLEPVVSNFIQILIDRNDETTIITHERQKKTIGELSEIMEPFIKNHPHHYHFPEMYL